MFDYRKQPMEAVRKKMCSGVCFSLGVGNVIYSATSAEKYSCSVESGVTLAKLGVLLKICLITKDTEVFWILIKRAIVYRNTWLGNEKPLMNYLFVTYRSSRPEVFFKKGVLKNFTCNFIEKETLAHVFSFEFCKISKNTFSYITPAVAASEYNPGLS